jgi:hypothetical protein
MAVDLKTNGFFGGTSIIVAPDCMIKLEHGGTKDRIRKVLFDRVEQVIVWRRVPVVRVVIVSVLLGLPGLLLLLVQETALTVFALLLLVITGAALAYYLYCRKTTIRIVRAGRFEEVTGVFWPSRVSRLLEMMRVNIRATQAQGMAMLAEKQAAADAAAAAMDDQPPAEAPSENREGGTGSELSS